MKQQYSSNIQRKRESGTTQVLQTLFDMDMTCQSHHTTQTKLSLTSQLRMDKKKKNPKIGGVVFLWGDFFILVSWTERWR